MQPLMQWRRIFFLTLFMTTIIWGGLYPKRASADCWGCAITAEMIGQMMDNIWDQISGNLLMQLKSRAAQLMNSQLEQLISGVNGSGVLIISDWQQYLFEMPAEANKVFMNDFLSQTTRGKCSSLNFESIDPKKFKSNYYTSLCNVAQSHLLAMPRVVNIDQYSADPARSLREGDWRVLNSLLSNPANNPIGYGMMIEAVQAQDLANRRKAAEAEAIANQGYNSVKVGGVVVTPGRTVATISENVKMMGQRIIETASNPTELIGGMIVAVANRAVNQMLQRGFDQARQKIQKEVGQINSKIYKASVEINKTLGPASQYMNNVNQQLGNVNATRIRTGGGPPDCSNAGATGGGC